jgi:phosphatidylinositol glycan class B
MLTVMLPAFLVGIWFCRSRLPLVVVFFITLSYSFNPHKEFRFLLSALSICFVYCGHGFQYLKNRKWKFLGVRFFNLYLTVVVLVNGAMILYFSIFHQRGPVSIAMYLGNYENTVHAKTFPLEEVHFLTNCHATPFYSHVHRNIRLRQLDCSPQ